jgi:hypothetical protein
MEDIILGVAFFLTVGLSIYFFLQARTKERLACIEKGLDVMPRRRNPVNTGKSIFTIGLLMIGIALGFLVGNILYSFFGFDEDIAYSSMILLFGGLSLVISYLIKFKKEE